MRQNALGAQIAIYKDDGHNQDDMSFKQTWLIACIILIGCQKKDPEPNVSENATSSPTAWVLVEKPHDPSLLQAPAVVRTVTSSRGTVEAVVSMRVLRVHVGIGDHVSVGDPLLSVTSQEIGDAATSYLSFQQLANLHNTRSHEIDAMHKAGVADHTQVVAQKTQALTYAAEAKRFAAKLRAYGIDPAQANTITQKGVAILQSPVTGVVSVIAAATGKTYAQGAEPMIEIQGSGPARIEVRTGEPWPLDAKVLFIGSDGRKVPLKSPPLGAAVDPIDATARAWYAPLDPIELPGGLFGVAYLQTSDDLWEVPVMAVAQSTGESAVWRKRENINEKVRVDVWASSGATAIVRGNLQAGDRVAADSRMIHD